MIGSCQCSLSQTSVQFSVVTVQFFLCKHIEKICNHACVMNCIISLVLNSRYDLGCPRRVQTDSFDTNFFYYKCSKSSAFQYQTVSSISEAFVQGFKLNPFVAIASNVSCLLCIAPRNVWYSATKLSSPNCR